MISRYRIAVTFLIVTGACTSEAPQSVLSPVTARASASNPGAPYEVNVASLHLRTGQVSQLVATKSANGKSVPDASVSWSSVNPSIASVSSTGLVTAKSPGLTTVLAMRGSHRVEVPVTVVCAVIPLPLGITTGTISADDCLFSVAGRRSDYYSVASPSGVVMSFLTTGLVGIAGIKAETPDPTLGTVYGSRNIGTRFRVIGNGDPLQFYISGQDSTKLGAYSIDRSVEAQTHSCGRLTFVVPGATFGTAMSPSNSCAYNVQFSPLPQAIGKPLIAHRYWVRLSAAKSYTVKISGLSNSFDPAVSIFPNILGAAPIAQSIPGPLPALPSRSVTFTPSAEGYYLVEISSGRFIDNLVTWAVQTGPFTLAVSN